MKQENAGLLGDMVRDESGLFIPKIDKEINAKKKAKAKAATLSPVEKTPERKPSRAERRAMVDRRIACERCGTAVKIKNIVTHMVRLHPAKPEKDLKDASVHTHY